MEDSPTQAQQLRQAIDQIKNGKVWTSTTVENLEDALKIQDEYDVILLDLELKDSGHDQTLARLKEFRNPVVIHTQFVDRAILHQIRKAGISQVLFKGDHSPEPNELRQSILLADSQIELLSAANTLKRIANRLGDIRSE